MLVELIISGCTASLLVSMDGCCGVGYIWLYICCISVGVCCCGPYRTVLSEYRIRARGGRRVGSRRRGVSRSAKGFGGTWWW